MAEIDTILINTFKLIDGELRIEFRLQALERATKNILDLVTPKPATGIVLGLPKTLMKGTGVMANFPLKNDLVYEVPIQAVNAAGMVEPDPNDTFLANSSSASLGAAIGQNANGNPVLILTPMVQAGTDYSVTVSDSMGLKSVTAMFDIVEDATPVALQLDVADATTTSQPVPTNPGP